MRGSNPHSKGDSFSRSMRERVERHQARRKVAGGKISVIARIRGRGDIGPSRKYERQSCRLPRCRSVQTAGWVATSNVKDLCASTLVCRRGGVTGRGSLYIGPRSIAFVCQPVWEWLGRPIGRS